MGAEHASLLQCLHTNTFNQRFIQNSWPLLPASVNQTCDDVQIQLICRQIDTAVKTVHFGVKIGITINSVPYTESSCICQTNEMMYLKHSYFSYIIIQCLDGAE